MKKLLVILMVATFVLLMTSVALATDPTEDTPFTFIESPSAGGNPAIPSTGYSNDPFPPGAWKMGASNWRYKDSWDAAAKYEGSYRKFDTDAAGGKYDYVDDPLTTSVNEANTGPHGGYSTASNKCKTCHAVHRANGGFKLMRVDDPNNACDYCHVGTHLHSNKAAYFGGDGSIFPENGHTIGSGKSIPDSSTWQWLQPKTLTGGDTGEFSATVNIRQYNAAKNMIMMWSTERASYHAAGTPSPLLRWGPTLLTCISCHQPHNAAELIWRPDGAGVGAPIYPAGGYKLLRASPSGSIIIPVGAGRGDSFDDPTQGGSGQPAEVITPIPFGANDNQLWMETYSPWGIGYPLAIGYAVEDTLSAYNTGMVNDLGVVPTGASPTYNAFPTGWVGQSIYTQWKSSDVDLAETVGTTRVPRLTVWCADCHNLNIGYYEQIGEPNFRGEEAGQYHSDRTHSAGGRIDCVNCHSTNWSKQSSNWTAAVGGVAVSCSKCHWYNNGAAFYNATNAASDFPHAGATKSTKLLDDAYDASTEALDFICTRCHDLIGVSM